MRHHNRNKKFGRERNQRVALMQSLLSALIIRGKIETSEAKAKALRPLAEKILTLAKKGTPASRRIIIARLRNREKEASKLFKVIAPRYGERHGGYTRIVKLGKRKSDASPRAIIEFI